MNIPEQLAELEFFNIMISYQNAIFHQIWHAIKQVVDW